jgi:hypothetical protein
MRRVHFFLLIKSLNALDSVPGITTGQWGNGWAFRIPGEYPDNEFMIRRIHSFDISGTTWHLTYVMAVGSNWRLGCKLYRHLRRAAIAAPAKIRGPWTVPAFKAQFPAVSAKILREQDKDGNPIGSERMPMVWAGEDPEYGLTVDYQPSDADCQNDVTETDLFPVQGQP